VSIEQISIRDSTYMAAAAFELGEGMTLEIGLSSAGRDERAENEDE
jgi:hypothetical protein